MRIQGGRTVRGVSDFSTERYTALFERHSPAVFAYARRHSDASTAQDVVADTFLVAWRRRAELPEHALPWLLVTARNVLANRRRHESRQQRLIEAAGRLDAVAAAADGADRSVVERAAYLAALGRLTDGERESLLLVAWDGLSSAEAATVAGCSQRAFEVRLSRARARLTRAFEAESASEHADRTTTRNR